ncbi:MAG TPA: DUF3224 domain-containing protein [Acidimicrobiales bacterium]|jgi:hypothetical protein|nr:DUF3224 domain-containing protein [Acidimicrobiales bacterium]
MHDAIGRIGGAAVGDLVEGGFEVTSWSEEPATGLEGTVRVTTARIGQRFTGGIEAETIADMVMTYRSDGTAEFVGHHRVVGSVGDRSGSFVLRATGTYDGAVARTDFEVIEGSGTGGLVGTRGSGVASAGHGSTGTYRFELEGPVGR